MKRTHLMLLGMLLSSTAHAQVYEWFDADGNRHFSDQKPEGVEFRALGDPAANLSSYRPTAIRQQPPAAGSRADIPSPAESRRPAANAGAQDRQAVCAEYLARIDRIHDRLRTGYDEPTGNRLRARRSALRAAWRRDCN